LVNFGPQTKTL